MKKHLIILLGLILAFGSSSYAQGNGRGRGHGHGGDHHPEVRNKHHQQKSYKKGGHYQAGQYYDGHHHRPVRRVSSRHRHHSITYAPAQHFDYHYAMHGQHYRYHNGHYYLRQRGRYEIAIPPIGFRLNFAPRGSRHIIYAGRDYFVDGDLVFLFNPYYGYYERVYPPRGFWISCG